MKYILILLLFVFNYSFCQKDGIWNCEGTIIERHDSIQIEKHGLSIDTLKVKWINNKTYVIDNLTFTIINYNKSYYTCIVTDGITIKKLKMQKIR